MEDRRGGRCGCGGRHSAADGDSAEGATAAARARAAARVRGRRAVADLVAARREQRGAHGVGTRQHIRGGDARARKEAENLLSPKIVRANARPSQDHSLGKVWASDSRCPKSALWGGLAILF